MRGEYQEKWDTIKDTSGLQNYSRLLVVVEFFHIILPARPVFVMDSISLVSTRVRVLLAALDIPTSKWTPYIL